MHNLLYQMRQTAAARIAAILKARPKEVMPSAPSRANRDETGLPVNGAAPTAPEDEEFERSMKQIRDAERSAREQAPTMFIGSAPEDERAEFEQWEREAWGV